MTAAPKTTADQDRLTQLQLKIWKGEDRPVGIYKPKDTPIDEAAQQTIKKMLRLIPKLKKSSRVLVLGANFGTSARYLVEKYGCRVDCLNANTEQNAFNEQQIAANGWEKKISVAAGQPDSLPFDRLTYDLVWAQDLSRHGGKRTLIFHEVHRVLLNSGRFIFTDAFKSDECDKETLQKTVDPAILKQLVTPKRYDRIGRKAALQRIYYNEMSPQLLAHYEAVIAELERKQKKIIDQSSRQQYDALLAEAEAWKRAAEGGCIDWGIMIFQKINS